MEENMVKFEEKLKELAKQVDVLTLSECLNERGVTAQVCHNAQFYLRIVDRKKEAAIVGDKCFAHLLALLVAYGYVLQVGVA